MRYIICLIFFLMSLVVQAQKGDKKVGNTMSTGANSAIPVSPDPKKDKKIGDQMSQGSVAAEATQQASDPYRKMRLKLPFSNMEKEYFVEKVDHFFVLNGDILVAYDMPSTMSYSSDDRDHKWANATIPVAIDASIYNNGLSEEVHAAIREFNNRTEICIVPRTTEKDHVRISHSATIRGAGVSPVGRQEGQQNLFLASSATKGTVMHELLHAAGFYHEQSREDRRFYIRIIPENIMENSKHNFQIEEGVAGGNYDYCSIMHYSQDAFSKNGNPTIYCVQDGEIVPCPPCLGNREEFSQQDIDGIDKFYGNVKRFPCQNSFPDPGYTPPQFSTTGGPSASDFAMAKFRHRFKKAEETGFAGAYPNFYEGRQGNNQVGATIFLNKDKAIWADIPISYLGNPALNDFGARMRSTQEYATRAGFVGGFPNFFHEDYGKGIVCGTILLGNNAAEWRDVPLIELGNPALDDIGARMRSAHDYAVRNGYLSGFPNFFHARYGVLIYCGIILIKQGAGIWKEVVTVEGPR